MRRLLVVGLFFVVACGGSPAAPSSSPPGASGAADFSGFWSGTFTLTQCSGVRHCELTIGRSERFTLRLQQTGARATGVFTLSIFAVDLAGNVLKDGTLELRGEAPPASQREFDWTVTVPRLSLRLSPAAGIVGTLAYEMHPNAGAAAFAGTASFSGDVVNATRQDLSLFSSFAGMWKGRFVVRACTPIASFCSPYQTDDVSNFELQLTEDGDRVSGALAVGTFQVAVSGRAAGGRLTLDGEVEIPSAAEASRMRLTAWATARDALGQMRGTFDYRYEHPMNGPTVGGTAHAELWQVVRVP